MQSVVLIIPAALKSDADTLAELLGYGPNSYSVPLSADGTEPATHYGLHTWAEQSFLDMLSAENIPEGLEQYAPVKDAVIVSVRSDMTNHFSEILIDNNLQQVDEQQPNK